MAWKMVKCKESWWWNWAIFFFINGIFVPLSDQLLQGMKKWIKRGTNFKFLGQLAPKKFEHARTGLRHATKKLLNQLIGLVLSFNCLSASQFFFVWEVCKIKFVCFYTNSLHLYHNSYIPSFCWLNEEKK